MAKKATHGTRGERGAAGPRGARGQRGPRGASGAPGLAPEVVLALMDDIEKMRSEAAVQFKRMAQLQAQLDIALAELQTLRKQAKYDGPERRRTPRQRSKPPSRSH